MTPAAAPIGFILGLLFFGGLWFTVRRLPAAHHPVLLTLGSFWIRVSFVAAGFVFVTRGRWQNAVLCLAGFIVGRIVLLRWVRCT